MRTRWTGRSVSSRTAPSIFVPPRSTPSTRIAAPLATAPPSGREDGAEDAMPYAEGRTYHDADSHVMETPDWLGPYPDLRIREPPNPLFRAGVNRREGDQI